MHGTLWEPDPLRLLCIDCTVVCFIPKKSYDIVS